MALPRPPISASTPIPNQPFEYPEVYYLEGNQGPLPLGNGLYIDPATGAFTDIEPSPYIYCTPQFSNLPVTYPPYECETEVNTAGVTDFTEAWYECQYLTEFPCVDSSAVTDFSYAWYGCYGLTSFPTLDTSSGISFSRSWNYTGLTAFPVINTSNGVNFYLTWGYTELTSFPVLDLSKGENFKSTWTCNYYLESFPELDLSSGLDFSGCWDSCYSLTSFPPLDVSSGTNFGGAWYNCTSLTTFPAGMFDSCSATNFQYAWADCALSQTSVDNILISLDTAGQYNGTVNIDGGTSSPPSLIGWNAVASLEGKGWTVSVNGISPFSGNNVVKSPKPNEKQVVEFPLDPEPFQEFTDLATGVVYKWGRTRWQDGTFRADIPETEPDEAWAWLPIGTHSSEVEGTGKV